MKTFRRKFCRAAKLSVLKAAKIEISVLFFKREGGELTLFGLEEGTASRFMRLKDVICTKNSRMNQAINRYTNRYKKTEERERERLREMKEEEAEVTKQVRRKRRSKEKHGLKAIVDVWRSICRSIRCSRTTTFFFRWGPLGLVVLQIGTQAF